MRILIVEDDHGVSSFYEQVLGRDAAHVDLASDAQAALSHGLRSEYDLITLDICIPGLSGLEIAPILRNMNPHAVIAVISGYAGEPTAGLPECIDVAMAKPVTVDVLLQLTEQARRIQESLAVVRTLGEPLQGLTPAAGGETLAR